MKPDEFQDNFLASVQEDKLNESIADDIIPIGNLNNDRVIQIYHTDYFARMTEALGETFESIWFVLGDEDFFDLCKKFIISHPSKVKDLANYGQEMPNFIYKIGLLEEWPFLKDLAEFELNFWKMFHANYPIVEPLPIDSTNLSDTMFSFENVILYKSDWDVVSIWRNREGVAEDVEIDWEGKKFHLIFRRDISVHMLELSEKQYALLLSMQKGKNLGAAFDSIDISGDEVQDLFSKLKNENVPLVKWD
jgi:hypothetical protein